VIPESTVFLRMSTVILTVHSSKCAVIAISQALYIFFPSSSRNGIKPLEKTSPFSAIDQSRARKTDIAAQNRRQCSVLSAGCH
jgi:hypothetical protein